MQYLSQLDLTKVLFLDIETVPMASSFSGLPTAWQQLWEKKAKSMIKEDITASDIFDRAAIYAEFGKIVCIGVGIITSSFLFSIGCLFSVIGVVSIITGSFFIVPNLLFCVKLLFDV